MSGRREAVCVALALALSGCAGARTRISFDDTTYPISLSPTVLGRDGAVLMPEAREVVGRVRVETRAWGLLYSFIPLSKREDVSAPMNDQVAAVGGEAVVNLRVRSEQCGVNWAVVLTIIPLWPGCSRIRVDGEIIRELPRPGAEPGPEEVTR